MTPAESGAGGASVGFGVSAVTVEKLRQMSRDAGLLGTWLCAEPLGDEAGAADAPRLTRLPGWLPEAVCPGERGSSWSVIPTVPCLHGGTLDVGPGRGTRFGLPLRAVSEGALAPPRVSRGWEESAVLGSDLRKWPHLAHTHDFCRLLEIFAGHLREPLARVPDPGGSAHVYPASLHPHGRRSQRVYCTHVPPLQAVTP